MSLLSDYEVLTRNGFKDFNGIREVKKNNAIVVLLNDGEFLKCSLNHRIMTNKGWKLAKDLNDSDYIVKSTGDVKIFNVNYLDGDFTFYDLTDVKDGNEYITNNIVSHNCEFLGSSNTLISPQTIRRLVFKTPIKASDEGLRIYSDPVPNGLYTMVVDTSRGKGLDYSAFIVVDVSQVPYKTVATFRNNETPSIIYPTVVEQTAKYFNYAQVLIETNDVGQQVADILRDDLEYDNIIYTTSDSKNGQIITGGFNGVKSPGVKTSKQVKRIGCQVFKTLLENNKLIINDYHTIQEISRFALKGRSYEAEDGNDDLVMCHVLFAWMSTQPYFRELTSIDLRLKLYNEQQKMLEESTLPFGFINDGNKQIQEFEVVELENMSFDEWMRT